MTASERESALRRACAGYGEDGDVLYLAAKRRLEWRRRRGGKECFSCGESLPMGRYGPDLRTPDGLRASCRACENGGARRRYAEE